ncbi:hypothetical protein Pmani_033678 [Petrolisthes manimaculis]|uniref:Uncharacterized protein n=1 Tax=Petrolisthes manimaculis TaxID=1843537 RepID=A0AAE1NP87_9EUCA|nr:hypothetical protein Pmani_033678 [Petrolisthes manimaculis]
MGLCLGCDSDRSRTNSVSPEDDTCITIVAPSSSEREHYVRRRERDQSSERRHHRAHRRRLSSRSPSSDSSRRRRPRPRPRHHYRDSYANSHYSKSQVNAVSRLRANLCSRERHGKLMAQEKTGWGSSRASLFSGWLLISLGDARGSSFFGYIWRRCQYVCVRLAWCGGAGHGRRADQRTQAGSIQRFQSVAQSALFLRVLFDVITLGVNINLPFVSSSSSFFC